ncbi:hypothetical protein Rhein_2938 [Rheinheimera sp. A13L]|uniref:hypothetical protein n=1 Tax=Rheinheimera sp. A13L TaxID=506534 RepID=UPI0002125143|nr:hypothetical protein [Rheinheimera sp. A13L]EGM76961.1 hypothetical protein Rhein_2938 [Rheinheimera sp. A13L]
MNILDTKQIAVVSGGEFYSGPNLAAASRFAGALGFLAGSFQAGYTAGQWLNQNTPIQRWISEALY